MCNLNKPAVIRYLAFLFQGQLFVSLILSIVFSFCIYFIDFSPEVDYSIVSPPLGYHYFSLH